MKRLRRFFPFLLILGMLVIHLAIMNDYGLTWDFHYHFYAGGWFLGIPMEDMEPRKILYSLPDPKISYRLPFGPLVQIIPTASWFLLSKTFQLLPPDSAYHLPIIVVGVAGIAVLLFFLKEGVGLTEGVVAALFLFFTPRFFSDLHNNMKDTPSAAVFALNMWLIYRLYRFRRVRDLVFAAVGFAIAWNTKINSIFIPVVYIIWIAGLFILSIMKKKYDFNRINLLLHRRYLLALYCTIAPLLAYALWMVFWGQHQGQAISILETFGAGTYSLEVLLGGIFYCAGFTVPWYYAPWYLTITTPLPILISFFIGTAVCLKQIMVKKQPVFLLLLLWLTLPLSRYLTPKIGVIDGIRHFEEVLFPLAGIAGIGAVWTARWFYRSRFFSKKTRRMGITGVSALILSLLIATIIRYHPFEITYFNELVGGSSGAMGSYDLDYWGGSQKHAIAWVNAHAKQNAVVNIVMATDVGVRYLRPDLVQEEDPANFQKSDYIIVLNRQSFFYRYNNVYLYVLSHDPVYVVENQGVPLVWVFDNRMPAVPQKKAWWTGVDPCLLGG